MVSSKSVSGSGSGSLSESSTRDPRHSTRDDRQGRPRFRHRRSLFRVSRFLGFIQIGVGVGSLSESSTRDPRHSTRGDRQGRPRFRHRRSLFGVSGFHGFWFQGFIQIGIGIGIAIGIDCLTTKTRDGIARIFGERQGEFLIFMKFHVFHGFIQIGVGVGIAIAIGIGIVDPRPATFDLRRSTGTPAFPPKKPKPETHLGSYAACCLAKGTATCLTLFVTLAGKEEVCGCR